MNRGHNASHRVVTQDVADTDARAEFELLSLRQRTEERFIAANRIVLVVEDVQPLPTSAESRSVAGSAWYFC